MFFKEFPRNTRITLLLEPYSSVLACILTFYAVLYMQALGVDARQIGLIATLAGVAGLLTQAVAAPVINRLGRRRALLLFSLLCWSIPLLLWTLASGFVMFLVAALFFSCARITSVAWYCVITEEVDEARKSKVFGLMFIIASVGGLGTAVAGPVLERFGLVPAMRFLYGFACISMTLMFVIRHVLLTETQSGRVVNSQHAGLTLIGSMRKHLEAARENLGNRDFLRLTLVFVLFNFSLGMAFVQVLFLNNTLRLSVTQLSLLPPVTAAVGVVLYRLVVPRLQASNERSVMTASLLAYAAGLVALTLVPPGHLALALLAAGVIAAGAYLFQVAINAALNNRMGLLHKADAYSAVQLAVAVFTIPAGYLAGSLFAYRPEWALLAMAGVGVAAAGLLLRSAPTPTQVPAVVRIRGDEHPSVQHQA